MTRTPAPDTPVIYDPATKRWTIAKVPRPWRRYAANIATIASVVAVIFAGVWVAVQAAADMPHL